MTPDQIKALAEHPGICFIAVGLGILLSFVKRLYDLEQAGTVLSPVVYWRSHPYQVALNVLAAYLLASMWLFMGLLNAPLALLTGVGCEAAFDTLRARAAARMNDDTDQKSGV